jgi:hypothetical protein
MNLLKKYLVGLALFMAAAVCVGVFAGQARASEAAGFSAVSQARMTWTQAKAYCQQQGGKLPRIHGRDSWAGDHSEATKIEGFGAYGAPWPAGLPSEYYWTGTERSGDRGLMGTVSSDGLAWCVYDDDGKVVVTYDYQHEGEDARAACVP